MFLYYALGGGLGHVSRSLAILKHCAPLMGRVRLMISTDCSGLVRESAPCPVDTVPAEVMASKPAYLGYLQQYLRTHRIRAVILDTFPFGIVGEWAEFDTGLPSILIARSLRWSSYCTRLRNTGAEWPLKCLAIERPENEYETMLSEHSDMELLDSPISSMPVQQQPVAGSGERWAVVHAGANEERQQLIEYARRLMKDCGSKVQEPECIFPEHGIYPADTVLSGFSHIVSAAGYNMMAYGLLSGAQHHFLPFNRRFDDQHRRLSLYEEGTWLKKSGNGAAEAAGWMLETLSHM